MHSRCGRIPAARCMRYALVVLRETRCAAWVVQDGMDGVLADRLVALNAVIVAQCAFGPLAERWLDAVRCEARSASCRAQPDAKYEARVVPAGSDDLRRNAESTTPEGEAEGTQGSIHGRGQRLDAPRFSRRSRIVDTARTGRGLVLGGAIDSSRSGVVQNLRFAGHLMRCAGLGWFLGLLRI